MSLSGNTFVLFDYIILDRVICMKCAVHNFLLKNSIQCTKLRFYPGKPPLAIPNGGKTYEGFLQFLNSSAISSALTKKT